MINAAATLGIVLIVTISLLFVVAIFLNRLDNDKINDMDSLPLWSLPLIFQILMIIFTVCFISIWILFLIIVLESW